MRVLYYCKRALSMPPHIVIQKLAYKVGHICLNKKKRWVDRKFSSFSLKRAPSPLNHFIKGIDLASLSSEKLEEEIAHVLKHEFNLLGSGWVEVKRGMICRGIDGVVCPSEPSFGINFANRLESNRIQKQLSSSYTPIDWQIDFKSGKRWQESTWSEEIAYGNEIGADIKVPWELARMQHLVSLALGYGLKKQEKYLREFENQVLDFIAHNPPRYGVNWVCTMDVGIRVANWLFAYDLFSSFGSSFSNEFEEVFSRSIYEHGHHIFHHLEWDPLLRSNHYLANIAGLLFVSSYLPQDREIAEWRLFALMELEKETLSQFHPDGSNFEASTSYHRLSSEMVLFSAALASELDHQFSPEFYERVEKMADFIRDITKPDGTIVQFGDNDSGRFIKLLPEENSLDHRYLIEPLRNNKGLREVIHAHFRKEGESPASLAKYPDFGLYIQRKGPWMLAFRAGSIGQKGNGGHAHNDQLSFELAAQGVSVLVDPGTYVYTPLPEQRRRFRSTSMHNTLCVEGKEQNRDEGLFRMTDKAQGVITTCKEGIFVGEHQGFGNIHRRTLTMYDRVIEGVDETKEPNSSIFFHFAPHFKAEVLSQHETLWTHPLIKVRITSEQGSLSVVESEYSNAYGVKEESLALVLKPFSDSVFWKMELK